MDSHASNVSTENLVILVVDDDEDNRVLIVHQLTELYHCSLLTAADGESAIALARRHQPNLILLDIMLPDLDGIEVMRQLQQDRQQPKIPVIAVTALARQEEREKILAAGCDAYITKPYDLDDLERTICQQLNLLCCLS
jgi:two-component system, cell cycle response regulator DivK